MAEDKSKEEDPKERKNEYFDDDEDFGLPDLDYDELDDEDEDVEEDLALDIELETSEDTSSQTEEETVTETESEQEVSSSDSVEEVETASSETEEEDSLDLTTEELDEIDLQDIDIDNLSEEDLNLDDDSFYEEESYEDFEGGDAEASEGNETLAASKPTATHEDLALRDSKGAEYQYANNSSNRSSFTKIVIFGAIIFILLGFGFIYIYNSGGGEEKKVAKKEVKKTVSKKKEASTKKKEDTPKKKSKPSSAATDKAALEKERKAKAKREAAAKKAKKPAKKEAAPAKPIAGNSGEVVKLSSKTGNTYVIIGSFVDEDLAGDYANTLAASGQSPTVIPPFDDHRFYRVAIASFNSFQEANGALAGFKSDYGEDIWALRY